MKRQCCGTGMRMLPSLSMFEHLRNFDPEVENNVLSGFVPEEKAPVDALLAAKVETQEWLKELGVLDDETVSEQASATMAREAFAAVTTDSPTTRAALAAVKTPAAVRHLTGMLAAYDWEFVEQAKELRGYAVAKITEETKHPDARIRLRALELLGRVTEVALFTERVEITKKTMSDEELNAKIKEKMNGLLKVTTLLEKPLDVSDVEPK